jgi:hypothetical protein
MENLNFYSVDEATDILDQYKDVLDIHQFPEFLVEESFRIKGEPLYWIKQFDGTIFIMPLVKRPFNGFFDLTSPYGYPGFYSNIGDSEIEKKILCQFFEESKRVGIISTFIRLNPFLNHISIDEKYIEQKFHGSIIYIDLNQKHEILKLKFSENHKRDINKNAPLLKVFKGESSDLNTFLQIYYETMERNEANKYYYFSEDYLKALFNVLKLKLYLVKNSFGDIIGGSLLMSDKNKIYYFLGATKSTALKLSPLKVLFDYLIQKFQASEKVLCLGGGFAAQEDNLFRFKKGFSQNLLPFSTIRMIHDPVLYRKLSIEKESSDFFPSYRKKIE